MKLDIGCGGSEQFQNHKVRGDINCDILKPSRKVSNFVLCDAHFLPFRDGIFDTVFMCEIIKHLQNPAKALKQAYRVLKNKGLLKLTTPNSLHILKIARTTKRGFYTPHKDHIVIWGLPELKTLSEKAGFKKIKIAYMKYRERNIKLIEKIILLLCFSKPLKSKLLYVQAQKT